MTIQESAASSPAPSRIDVAVQLEGIRIAFDGVRVLNDLTLTVHSGTIHALLGGNGSGKSTTLKTLAGIYVGEPGGSLTVNGVVHPTEGWTPERAFRAGLRFVHQDLALVDDLTVAENFGLVNGFPRNPVRGIGWRRLRRETKAALEALELETSPDSRISDLRPSERTMVAIARSLGAAGVDPAITIVLDEPTASLPHSEVELLLTQLRRCRERGQTIIYVSHRLQEVFRVADRVSVLRDGRLVADESAADLDERAVVAIMAGDGVPGARVRRESESTEATHDVLSVHGLSSGPLVDFDFSARSGEIVGIAGLTGSGRSSLLRSVFGHARRSAGEIRVDGRRADIRHPADAMRFGVAFVPEDRKRDAAFLDATVWENISAAVLSAYWHRGRFDRRRERRDSAALMRRFDVKASAPDLPIRSLSGGNQQKAIMARWLQRNPRVLLLDEPSQGVDAVARAEIHGLIREHVGKGNTAVVVSSDDAELVSLCDRVIVLRSGRRVAQLVGDALTEDRITYMAQFEPEDVS